MVILDYFELSEEETLDLALENNEGIFKIVLEDEYEESDYEKTSHMIKSSLINLGDLQEVEFIIDNDNEYVNKDQVLPII